MKTSRVIISLVMTVVAVASLCLFAAATEMEGSSGIENIEEYQSIAVSEMLSINNIQLQPAEMPFVGSNGVADVHFLVSNYHGETEVVVTHILPNAGGSIGRVTDLSGEVCVEPGEMSWVSCTVNLTTPEDGLYYETLNVYFQGISEPVRLDISLLNSNTVEDEDVQEDMELDEGETDESYSKIRVSTVDAYGTPISTPSGNASEAINVRVPLMSKGETIYDLEITPVLSENLDEFPFLIERLDYTQVYEGRVLPYDVIEFDYSFTLSSYATSGTKKVEFQVSYWFEDRLETATVPVFVNVVKGYEEAPKQEVEIFTSTPKVIVQSFSVDRDQIYAGESFTIDVELKNTSSQNIKNLKMTVSEESGAIFPALETKNSIYVERISAQETTNVQLCLQSPADLQEKNYRLSILLEYESSVNNQTFSATETVSIYVMQPVSVKIQNPIIYEEAWLDQRCSGSILLFNMGRSSIYNCMVTIEGSGLSLEENYFGGTVAAGASMRAEFEIVPRVEGEVKGNIVITYEDISGNKFEEKCPVSLYVNKDYTQTVPDLETPKPSEKSNNSSSNAGWLIIVLVIALGVCIALPFAIVRRNQKRKLKDL